MSKKRRSVTVRVPASTSNLGPGFDCLGLALALYNELTLSELDAPGEPVVEIEGQGARTLPLGADNLIVRAAGAVVAGRNRGRLLFQATNRIPLARGLGSSAAAAVAGVLAADALFGPRSLDARGVFQYAGSLEGHPDNAAAAVFGGLVTCVKTGKDTLVHAAKPHKELCAVVCVPGFELSTAKAREVLPLTVLREQAVENIGRTALLVPALERGRWALFDEATRDTLHQSYRSALVPGLEAVLAAARRAGECGAFLSGAGPSVAALCRRGPATRRIAEAMMAAFAEHKIDNHALVLGVDPRGARVVRRK